MQHTKSAIYKEKEDANPNLPAKEAEVLKFWEECDLLGRTTDKPHDREFIFFDGPPFANGLPHYGHLLTGYAKDSIGRAHTMLGARVERRFGWDCHGLPAEMAAEKELGVSGKKAIEQFGVGKFSDHCASSVMKYAQEWQKYVKRQGRLASFDNEYKTMDLSYMESLIWAFKKLYDMGMIYKDFRVMPYSWACETPLSNFEIRLDDSYRDKTSKSVVVSFKLKGVPKVLGPVREVRLLAWTTTPWTLPSNTALAVNSQIEYECMEVGGVCYVASNLKPFVADINKLHGIKSDDYSIYAIVKGEELLGFEYEPLFPYFQDIVGAFRVLDGSFVTKEEGTGVVHMAPGFGEDDFNLCKQHGIPVVCPITAGALFTSEVPDFEGMMVFDANDKIIMALKSAGYWVKTDQYIHSYPHCWRTDTPLIYRAMPSWYVAVSKISSRMVELAQDINWVPSYAKEQFNNWLANATDWSISRNRFFGTPIPVWQSDDPQYPRVDVYGSIAELEKDFNVKVTDLHPQFIDKLTRKNPDDPTGQSMMLRVPEVLDCWFESGSMSFASSHYPFDRNSRYGPSDCADIDTLSYPPKRLPADFIVEYAAQIRGWFYTLMVMSSALFDAAPFRNVICHGMVLDGDGKKLSKRLNNYVDSYSSMEEYGSDAMRFLMLSSPVVSGGSLFIDKEQRVIADIVRLQIKPIWNAYFFLLLYANADKAELHEYQPTGYNFDRYIYLKMHETVAAIRSAIDSYKIDIAYKAISAFFDTLNNWYIRRNKKRFWGPSSDKQSAYNTLYTVLNNVVLAMAPFVPFLAEAIYIGLNNGGVYDDIAVSVHMQNFPNPPLSRAAGDDELVKNMEFTRDICNAALAIRNRNKVRVRQPLPTLLAVCHKDLDEYFCEIIKDEINVKEVIIEHNVEKHCSIKPKVNFSVVGKRVPHLVQRIMKNLSNWQRAEDGSVRFGDDILLADEVNIAMEALEPQFAELTSDRTAVVVLNTRLVTEELWAEGVARDVVRSIQTARQSSFEISDRIISYLYIEDSAVSKACITWKSYIMEQTLSVEMIFDKIPEALVTMRFDINDRPILLGMCKKV